MTCAPGAPGEAKAKAKAKVKAKAKAKAESKETPRGPLAEGGAADVQFCGKGGEAGKNHGALQVKRSFLCGLFSQPVSVRWNICCR